MMSLIIIKIYENAYIFQNGRIINKLYNTKYIVKIIYYIKLKMIENSSLLNIKISALVTIIIPTINRSTLINTLESLEKQIDPDWKAICIFDFVYVLRAELAHVSY